MSARYGYFLLVLVWFSWGLAYPSTAIALTSFDVWTSRIVVTGAAGVIMLAFVGLRGASIAMPRRHWLALSVAAFFNIAVFQIGMTFGVALLSPGRTAIIVYTMPVWASMFAMAILGERLTGPRAAALLLGLAAIGILMSQDLSNLANAPLGAGLTLMGSISFAFGTVWMKRVRWTVDPTLLGGWQLLIGTVPLLLIWLAIDPTMSWGSVTIESWIAVAYLILFANAVAYFAWYRVVAIFPVTVSGIGTLAVPIIGVLSSAALVGEQIGWRELAALFLVCAALALVLFVPAREVAKPAQ